MFDVGMSEMVVIGGAAILLLGKHDMPLVFRLVGRGVGKVSGLVQGGRARMNELSKGSDLLQLQNEIRSNLDDLRVIKAELRGAAQLPSSITRSSHPGSNTLRDQASVSGTPPSGGVSGGGGIPASPAHTSFSGADHLTHRGGAGAGPAAASRWRAADGNSSVLPRSATIASSAEAPSRDSSLLDRLPAAGSGAPDMRTPESRGNPREAGGRGAAIAAAGGGSGGGNGLGGLSSTLPPPQQAVQSVASAGGDRLQRLAMAEIGFAEKELYAPKTDSIPGGADILNEAITDSLLQERYRRMLSVARGGTGDGDGGGDSDGCEERRPPA
eukprot:g9743.t1